MDELSTGLKAIAKRVLDELPPPTGGGHLIRRDLDPLILKSQFAVYSRESQEAHERWLAREAAMSRVAKWRRSIRIRVFLWRGRLELARDVLLGRHECGRD